MTQQIALRISDQLARRLDDAVVAAFENRSEALRVAVEEFVERQEAAQKDRAIVEGYRRLPAHESDEWGPMPGAHALTATILAQALDAEDGGW